MCVCARVCVHKLLSVRGNNNNNSTEVYNNIIITGTPMRDLIMLLRILMGFEGSSKQSIQKPSKAH